MTAPRPNDRFDHDDDHEISQDGPAELVTPLGPHPRSVPGGSLSGAEQVAGEASNGASPPPDNLQDRSSVIRDRSGEGGQLGNESSDTEQPGGRRPSLVRPLGAPLDDAQDFFDKRGITLEVREARPYIRYTANDPSPVQEAYKDLPQQGQRGFMTSLATQVDGWIITRHAPPGMGLAHIFPEIRPDTAVRTGPPESHHHPLTPSQETPLHPTTRRPLSQSRIYTAWRMRAHIMRAHGGKAVAAKLRYDTPEKRERLLDAFELKNDSVLRLDLMRVLRECEADYQDPHSHQDPAKYVFPPSPKIEVSWWHNHAVSYADKPDELAAHVHGRHRDGNVPNGPHEHKERVKDPDASLAKRIDMHPLLRDKLADAQRVFFAIEGCIKADAIQSAGHAVFSVPSVTLWDEKELALFARKFLRDKEVIVVPDSDWASIPAVLTQALQIRTTLRQLNIEAHVAAPPPTPDGEKQGVDDFLATGGTVEGLLVIDREVDRARVLKWLTDRNGWGGGDQQVRAVELIECLALHAGENGTIKKSVQSLARLLSRRRSRVRKIIEALEGDGALIVEGDLDTRKGAWFGTRYVRGIDWVDLPTITIQPELRATSLPPRPLGPVGGVVPREPVPKAAQIPISVPAIPAELRKSFLAAGRRTRNPDEAGKKLELAWTRVRKWIHLEAAMHEWEHRHELALLRGTAVVTQVELNEWFPAHSLRSIKSHIKARENQVQTGTAPTISERIASVEGRLEQQKREIVELARQVGITFDDAAVREAVEQFLDGIERDSSTP